MGRVQKSTTEDRLWFHDEPEVHGADGAVYQGLCVSSRLRNSASEWRGRERNGSLHDVAAQARQSTGALQPPTR